MRRKRLLWLTPAFFGCLALPGLVFLLAKPTSPSYSFVTVDHPIDMWSHGKDKWAYFGTEFGSNEPTVKAARAELLPLGFKEDSSKKPWHRFVKGSQEVVVCYHHEFEVNGNVLAKNRYASAPKKVDDSYICVLVKNGPGTEESLPTFKAKKLIYRW